MQLMLRPPAARFHPLMHPWTRRYGLAGLGQSNVNPTTIFLPGTGPGSGFLATPGNPATASGGPAVFQAPATIPPPACTQDTQPGGAAFSQACIAQLLATQQQNMAAWTGANYSVDRANCEQAWAENNARYQAAGIVGPPNDCAQRTFGLTLPGTTGGTSADLSNAQALLDPNYTGPGSSGPGAGSPPAGGAPPVTPSLSFTNLTSGNNAKLTVGDRWQIQIRNASPNAPVSVKGGQNGQNITTPMGSTDSQGNWTSNGQVSSDMIGSWFELWTVGNQTVGQFSFQVIPAGGSSTGSTATGGSVTGSFTDLLSKTTTIGGVNVPEWAIIAGGIVALIVLMKVAK